MGDTPKDATENKEKNKEKEKEKEFQGSLWKLGEKGILHLWRKRWFVIHKNKLKYYTSKDEVNSESGEINFILLDENTEIKITSIEAAPPPPTPKNHINEKKAQEKNLRGWSSPVPLNERQKSTGNLWKRANGGENSSNKEPLFLRSPTYFIKNSSQATADTSPKVSFQGGNSRVSLVALEPLSFIADRAQGKQTSPRNKLTTSSRTSSTPILEIKPMSPSRQNSHSASFSSKFNANLNNSFNACQTHALARKSPQSSSHLHSSSSARKTGLRSVSDSSPLGNLQTDLRFLSNNQRVCQQNGSNTESLSHLQLSPRLPRTPCTPSLPRSNSSGQLQSLLKKNGSTAVSSHHLNTPSSKNQYHATRLSPRAEVPALMTTSSLPVLGTPPIRPLGHMPSTPVLKHTTVNENFLGRTNILTIRSPSSVALRIYYLSAETRDDLLRWHDALLKAKRKEVKDKQRRRKRYENIAETSEINHAVLDVIVTHEMVPKKSSVTFKYGKQEISPRKKDGFRGFDCTFIIKEDTSLQIVVISEMKKIIGEGQVAVGKFENDKIYDERVLLVDPSCGQVTCAVELKLKKNMSADKSSLLYHRGTPSQCIPLRLDTGDVLLFNNRNILSLGTKIATLSRWDHVALVYRGRNKLKIIEACSIGVVSGEFDDTISNLRPNTILGIRRIAASSEKPVRTKDMNVHLYHFLDEIDGRPFERNVLDLARAVLGVNTKEDLSSLFCSELVAACYQRMGLMTKQMVASCYTPKSWSIMGKPSGLAEGVALERKILFFD